MPLTLATWLTVARIAAIIPIALLLALDTPSARWAAAILFVAAAITDWIDGHLARTRDQVTALGRCLDPIADKLLVATVLVMLVADGTAPLLPVLIIVLRELTVSGLREALAGAGPALPVTKLAKWKTTVQMAAVVILCVAPAVPGGTLMGTLLLWLAALMTAVTGAQYTRAAVAALAAAPARGA